MKFKGLGRVFTMLKRAQQKDKDRISFTGHNCMMDLLFLMSHFVENPLPSYDLFKSMINKYFYNLYDTKVMFNY